MTHQTRGDRWPAARAARPRRALILDDEADRRHEMCEGLLDHGVVGEEAATLGEAISRLATSSYDLVVCDLILCDPPDAANPALRGYLAVCFALARPDVVMVVQASSQRRWVHPGAVLTNWRVEEVANLVYGSPGIPARQRSDGGCPWFALEWVAGAAPARRRDAVERLARLPIVRELEGSLGLGPALAALEDAAEGLEDWPAAVASARCALFPGAGDAV